MDTREQGRTAHRFWDRIGLAPQAVDPSVRSTLRRSFFAYAAVLLLIGWAYALWYIAQDHRRTIETARDQLRTVATSLNAQMEAMLGDGLGSAQSAYNDLATTGDLRQQPMENIARQLREQVTGNYIRALLVGNSERTIVVGSSRYRQSR